MALNRRNFDGWCEHAILILVLAVLAFSPLAFGVVFTWTFLVVQTLVTVAALVWLARIWGGHKPQLLWPPLLWAVAAFVAYAVARYFTADVEYPARLELIRVLLYAVLLVVVVSNVCSQDSVEIVAWTLTAVAVFAASYALVQFGHHSNHVWFRISPYPGRASGTYINPDHFAGFLELVLPLPLAFLLSGRVGVTTRVLLVYGTLAIMGGIAVTFSRGGWVASTAGIAMVLGFLLCHRNHRLRAALVLVVLIGAGYVGVQILSHSPAYMRRVAKVDESGPAVMDWETRLEMWKAAAQMGRDHPLWGVGPGHFDVVFQNYRPQPFQRRPDHAHCDYVELFADWGLVGGIIVLGGIGVFIFGLVRSWPHIRRQENDFGSAMSNRYAFFIGAVSGLFALAVHSLIDFNLHIPGNALVGVVLLGLVASNIRFATKRHWVGLQIPLKCVVTIVLGGLTVYFCAQMWRRGNEELWLARAELQNPFSPEQVQALKKALACEPQDYQTAYNIGECYWARSLNGEDDYADQASHALDYYTRAANLDRHDPDSRVRSGMCLDWLGRHEEAEKLFTEAELLDPNGDFVAGNIGWHFMQVGDYSAARQWFIRANKLGQNDTARTYLYEVCEPKLVDRGSGRIPISLYENGKVR
jgi:O-antigen ligase